MPYHQGIPLCHFHVTFFTEPEVSQDRPTSPTFILLHVAKSFFFCSMLTIRALFCSATTFFGPNMSNSLGGEEEAGGGAGGSAWTATHRFQTNVPCGERPTGIAVCMALQTLVVNSNSDSNLHLYTIQSDGTLVPAGTIGGPGTGPLQFNFSRAVVKMAFTVPHTAGASPRPTLLVADAFNDRVQEVDVVDRVHVGYLFPPGTLTNPVGVAVSSTVIAVSTTGRRTKANQWVHLFDAGTRDKLWSVGGPIGRGPRQLNGPCGLCLTADGVRVAVADCYNNRIVVLSVADGSPLGHVPTCCIYPYDVEECEGGWLVAAGYSHGIAMLHPAGGAPATYLCGVHGPDIFSLALAPGLGLVVPAWNTSRIQVRV